MIRQNGLRESPEVPRRIADEHPVFFRAVVFIIKIRAGQQFFQGPGSFIGRVHQRDPVSQVFPEKRPEKRIMRASHDQRIDILRQKPAQIPFCHRKRDLILRPALFDQRHKKGAGLPEDPDLTIGSGNVFLVQPAVDGAVCRDHADALVFRGAHGGARARFYNADDRNIRFLFQIRERKRARGIAGDHDGLYILFF